MPSPCVSKPVLGRFLDLGYCCRFAIARHPMHSGCKALMFSTWAGHVALWIFQIIGKSCLLSTIIFSYGICDAYSYFAQQCVVIVVYDRRLQS